MTEVQFSVRKIGESISSTRHLATEDFGRGLDGRVTRLSHPDIPTLVYSDRRESWVPLAPFGSGRYHVVIFNEGHKS